MLLDVGRKSLVESSNFNFGSTFNTENRGRNNQKGCNQGQGISKSRERP